GPEQNHLILSRLETEHAVVRGGAKQMRLQQHGKKRIPVRRGRIAENAISLHDIAMRVVLNVDGKFVVELNRARTCLNGIRQIEAMFQTKSNEELVEFHDHSKADRSNRERDSSNSGTR